jgi:hypothetical protein
VAPQEPREKKHFLCNALFHHPASGFDAFVRIRKMLLSVIPAKAGIQSFQVVPGSPDPGFHRGDDLLPTHPTLTLGDRELDP